MQAEVMQNKLSASEIDYDNDIWMKTVNTITRMYDQFYRNKQTMYYLSYIFYSAAIALQPVVNPELTHQTMNNVMNQRS